MIELSSVRLALSETVRFTYHVKIMAGESIGLVGGSGAGKSTLLSLIGGFLEPHDGRIILDGIDHTHSTPFGRPVSMMFQSNNTFDHLDVATNVGLGVSPHFSSRSSDLHAVREALAKVGLDGFEERRGHSLSGGEAQRVALARALLRDKPILLLDEPFAALGPSMRASFVELLKRFKEEQQLTVVTISHAPHELEGLCDRLLFVEDGRIVQDGPFAELLTDRSDTPLGRYLGRSASR